MMQQLNQILERSLTFVASAYVKKNLYNNAKSVFINEIKQYIAYPCSQSQVTSCQTPLYFLSWCERC